MLKISITISSFALLLLGCVNIASAATGTIEILPQVIDEKAKAAEQIEKLITVKNGTERKVDIYPLVNDITMDGGKQEFNDPHDLDKSASLARWIRIQRGAIQLMPGESKEVSFEIQINQGALPGKYYAAVSFPTGSNSLEAEANSRDQAVPTLLVNLEIADESVEKAQLVSYKASKNIFLRWPARFTIVVKNIGTVELKPQSSIYLFNRRDQFLETVNANESGESIAPGETKEFSVAWNRDKGLGKFKAKLEMEYGSNDKRDLSDTVFFWVLPTAFLAFLFIGLFTAVSFLTFYLYRRTYVVSPADDRNTEGGETVINLRK